MCCTRLAVITTGLRCHGRSVLHLNLRCSFIDTKGHIIIRCVSGIVRQLHDQQNIIVVGIYGNGASQFCGQVSIPAGDLGIIHTPQLFGMPGRIAGTAFQVFCLQGSLRVCFTVRCVHLQRIHRGLAALYQSVFYSADTRLGVLNRDGKLGVGVIKRYILRCIVALFFVLLRCILATGLVRFFVILRTGRLILPSDHNGRILMLLGVLYDRTVRVHITLVICLVAVCKIFTAAPFFSFPCAGEVAGIIRCVGIDLALKTCPHRHGNRAIVHGDCLYLIEFLIEGHQFIGNGLDAGCRCLLFIIARIRRGDHHIGILVKEEAVIGNSHFFASVPTGNCELNCGRSLVKVQGKRDFGRIACVVPGFHCVSEFTAIPVFIFDLYSIDLMGVFLIIRLGHSMQINYAGFQHFLVVIVSVLVVIWLRIYNCAIHTYLHTCHTGNFIFIFICLIRYMERNGIVVLKDSRAGRSGNRIFCF